MLILAGTIAVLIGLCLISAGIYRKEEKEKKTPEPNHDETE